MSTSLETPGELKDKKDTTPKPVVDEDLDDKLRKVGL